MAETYLTRAGLKKLQDEYKALQKRKIELQQEVNTAAALGDLRENGEYHAAKEHLMHVGTRLTELEMKLGNVRIIDDLDVAAGEARVGTRVTLIDVQMKEEVTYTLVGPEEADPQQGKISIVSPLGKSVLGKKEGDEFTLELPRAKVPYKVKKVDRPS